MAVGSVQDYMLAAVAVSSMQDGAGAQRSLSGDGKTEAAAPPNVAAAAAEKARQEADAAAAHEKKKPINEEQAAYITKQLNEIMRRSDVNLNFQYHKEINVMSVRMLDKKTGELLREIPAESLVEHMIKVRDWLGAFLDKTA